MSLERDIELMRANKPEVIRHVKKNGLESLSLFCATASLSLLVAHVYVIEDFPEYREYCEGKLQRLKDFYGYK